MSKVSSPAVKLIEEGDELIVKQMKADAGQLLPKHKASDESVIVICEGKCIMKFPETEHLLEEGESIIIPTNVWHQILVKQDFRALHIMPKGIQFEFTN